jgi:DNA polymerase-3 subunit alpha (Gram-positive type)
MKKYIIIDTETTGLDHEIHEMIAFGAIVMIDHVIVDSIEIKWHPVRPEQASEEAFKVNGYSKYAWRDSVGVDRAASLIDLFLTRHKDGISVGHNLYFDRRFIEAFGHEHEIKLKLSSPYLDTRDLCRAVLAPYGLHSMRLDDICEFLGWKRRRAHSALSDCEDCAKIIKCMAPPSQRFIARLKLQQMIRKIRGLL